MEEKHALLIFPLQDVPPGCLNVLCFDDIDDMLKVSRKECTLRLVVGLRYVE